jgi:trans-2,3-dihydro-3-hydroxyanthranilate isomerase
VADRGLGGGRLPYRVVDVFTDRAYAGNPLAVVLDGEHLTTEQMQAIAVEANLSETAFPLRPTDEERARGVDYRLRIFTVSGELPFAGHPSVGTAWVLADEGRVDPGPVLQACGAGDLPLSVHDDGRVELAGGRPEVLGSVAPGPVLAAVGLGPDDVDPAFAGQDLLVCTTGLDYVVLPVAESALTRCAPDQGRLRALADPTWTALGVYVVAWHPATSTARARMFAGDLAAVEDPATGSAALAYGVWLARTGLLPDGGAYDVVQGVEMGRPSSLRCQLAAVAGRAVQVRVSGFVTPVAEGTLVVPGAVAAAGG